MESPQVGDRVTVSAGKLAGLSGTVVELLNKCAEVEFNVFGHPLVVNVRLNWLELSDEEMAAP